MEKKNKDALPKNWQKLLMAGWIIKPTSCACGGNYAWLKPHKTDGHEMHGCVCHNTPTNP